MNMEKTLYTARAGDLIYLTNDNPCMVEKHRHRGGTAPLDKGNVAVNRKRPFRIFS
jgi:hypothetical protein